MKMTVYQVRYEVVGTSLIIHLFGRGEDRKRVHKVLTGMKPYLYLPFEPRRDPRIVEVVKEGSDIDNNPLWKVYVKYPFDVPGIRSQYPVTYEADVPFGDRVKYDLGIWHTIEVPDKKEIRSEDVKPLNSAEPIPPRVADIDIENDDSGGLALPKNPTAEVYCLTIEDYDTDTYTTIYSTQRTVDLDQIRAKYKGHKQKFREVSDERALFKATYDYFHLIQPDIITNWNINYDLDYLSQRAKVKGYVKISFRDFARMDALTMYKKRRTKESDSLKLDFVSKAELGEGKVQRPSIKELYQTDMETLLIYNIKDVELVRRILKKRKLLSFYVKLVQFIGGNYESFAWNSQLADAYFLHKCNGILVLPTKTRELKEGIDKGATVLDAFVGVKRNVFVLDLKTAYPNGVRTLNISQETYVKNPDPDGDYNIAPSGRCYLKEPRGLVPLLYDELVELRYEMREGLKTLDYKSPEYKVLEDAQEVLKFFTNSIYGLMGSPYFRLSSGKVGSDITAIVRMMIEWVVDLLERSGFTVIYGDTDGIMFQIPQAEGLEAEDLDKMLKWAKKIVKAVNKSFDKLAKRFNVDKHYFEIKLDRIDEVAFQWGAKKHYIEVPLWDGKDVRDKTIEERIIVKGARSKRRDSCLLTRRLLKDVFECIVKDEIDKLRRIIKKAGQDIENGLVDPRDLGMPSGWKKEHYKNEAQQLKAAKYSNKYLDKNYKFGDEYWLYLGTIEGKPKGEVVALDWDDDPEGFGLILDNAANVERWVVKPTAGILEALGMSYGEIRAGVKRTNLTKWMDG